MSQGHSAEETDRAHRVEACISTVLGVLEGMGKPDASPGSVLTAPPFYDGPVLLRDSESFARFIGQIAVRWRFIGYPMDEVAFLTVRDVCEMYVRDSYPPVPGAELASDAYEIVADTTRTTLAGGRKDFPVGFVLGSPRSGSTLFRAMLDGHSRLWAPGELHMANFETMSHRAEEIMPLLRYMPIPEAATRCRESVAAFAATFRRWERESVPITEVYETLHRADPDAMVIDKSPPYCMQRSHLDRIGEQFPNARFIHLVRSPHDVIRSFVRLQLHRGSKKHCQPGLHPYQVGEAVWHACNANAEAFLRDIPSDRHCTVRYEELVSDPMPSLQRACDVLERAFEPEMADPYTTSGPVARGAGDLHINLLKSVEARTPIDAFFPLGEKARRLAARLGYGSSTT